MIFRRLFLVSLTLAFSLSAIEYHDNFRDGNADGWTAYTGNWSVQNGAYKINSPYDDGFYDGAQTKLNSPTFSNLLYEADVTVSLGEWESGLIFRATNWGSGEHDYNGYCAAIDQNDKVILIRGPGYNVIAETPMSIEHGRSYRLQVWSISERIRVYVDGDLKIDIDDDTYSSGNIGLMTYTDPVVFDNILATSETQNAMRDDFNDGNDNNWIKYDGSTSFSVTNGRYTVLNSAGTPKTIFDISECVDYIYRADVTINNYEDAGLLFRVTEPGSGQDNYKGYYASLSEWGGLQLSRGPGWNVIAEDYSSYNIGQTYHVRIETMGPEIKIYVDDNLQISTTDESYNAGRIGINSFNCDATFDNIAVSPNIQGALAKRTSTGNGTWGTPKEWDIITYNHPTYVSRWEAPYLRDAFRDHNFGWLYTSTDGGGPGFTYDKFSNQWNNTYEMVYVSSHGNDGLFYDYNDQKVYLRDGYGARSAYFTGETRFVVLSTCASLWTGHQWPYDATPYLPVFKGVHAILGHAAICDAPPFEPYIKDMVDYFVSKWHGSKEVGIYPAWREAVFQAWYYDNDLFLSNAPAVVFTAGDLKGQLSEAGPYWGWEEKTWNMYNGCTYISESDKNIHGHEGEVLTYNPDYGYPDKIGHKWDEIGEPEWDGIVPLP